MALIVNVKELTLYFMQCINDLDKLYLVWWVGFGLKPIFADDPSAT